jgi:hypothetical protein
MLRIKNRPVFIVSTTIVLWLLYVNVLQRFSLQQGIEYLNNELKDYVIANPKEFDNLVLNLSSSLGVWDEQQHRVITLLRPEHCDVSYWMSSVGSNSQARIDIGLEDLDLDGITEGLSSVEAFLQRDAQSIIVELRSGERTLEQCEIINGHYAGGCWYGFETRSVIFFTLKPKSFAQELSRIVKRCGGKRSQER